MGFGLEDKEKVMAGSAGGMSRRPKRTQAGKRGLGLVEGYLGVSICGREGKVW